MHCQHSVYVPAWVKPGASNPYCSICTPPSAEIFHKKRRLSLEEKQKQADPETDGNETEVIPEQEALEDQAEQEETQEEEETQGQEE